MKGTIKKIANGDLPTGPDKYYGGDGLPDRLMLFKSFCCWGSRKGILVLFKNLANNLCFLK